MKENAGIFSCKGLAGDLSWIFSTLIQEMCIAGLKLNCKYDMLKAQNVGIDI